MIICMKKIYNYLLYYKNVRERIKKLRDDLDNLGFEYITLDQMDNLKQSYLNIKSIGQPYLLK